MVVESVTVDVKVIVAESVSVEVTVTNVVVATIREPEVTTVPLLLVTDDELSDVDVAEAAEVVVLDVVELLTDVLVVDAGRGGPLTPQTMFIATGKGVAYIVGLAPELAEDEA